MNDFDIAVIGYGCRVPGASDEQEFWENLAKSREALLSFSDAELRAEGVSEEFLGDPHFVKAGTVLKDVDLFDASFFGFTPAEAETLDPQQRIFLELASEVTERAGYGGSDYRRPIGVYAGMSTTDYVPAGSKKPILNLPIVIGREKDFLATLASYKLNLIGPSITVQTACSTSLVAIHLACQGLLAGDCAMALAGGVSIITPAKKGYLYEPGGILSPDGRCRAFDRQAGGTVGGSGAGLVLLKPLKDAAADGDIVHAVIKGSAINNDGSLKVGYTAPSVEGQAKVIRAAQLVAGVEADTISYVEAHGTGTPVGDPIEVAALTKAFRASTERKGFCAIGSVKTNLGHLNTAAGVIGFIKTVLSLKHRQIPASLHFEVPNPNIDFQNTPFFVNRELRQWEGPRPLRAGVSSFGVGGTNAHMILEEAPEIEPSGSGRSAQLLVLSACTHKALDAATHNLITHLQQSGDESLADIAYTLQVGRREFTHRRAVVCNKREHAIEHLQKSRSALNEGKARDEGTAVVFMFPGQGAQFVGMGHDLYREERRFRNVVDDCSEKLKPMLGLDLRQVLYPFKTNRVWAEQRLQETAVSQPAAFVIEYALARFWMQWGIEPQAMLGHSIGEYAAACLAGVMVEDDALRLVSIRGRLMQEQPPGSMLAIELSEEEALHELEPGLWLAAVNGRKQCVLSGTRAAITEAQMRLEKRFVTCHVLRTSHGFHSGMMEPLLGAFARAVKTVHLHSPQLRYVSSVSGDWITPEEATDPEYWVNQLRQTVRFGKGIRTIINDIPNSAFVEVGPGDALAGIVREEGNSHEPLVVVSSLPKASSEEGEMASLLSAAGKLWVAGARLLWRELHEGEKRLRVPLPTYPFEKKRYWISNEVGQDKTVHIVTLTKQPDIADWFYVPVWKQAPFVPRGEQSQGPYWLIFCDNRGLGQNLADHLALAGHSVLLVNKGEQLTIDEDAFTINPFLREHYIALVNELQRRERIPQSIVHLWSIPDMDGTSEGSCALDYLGCVSLLYLASSLEAKHVTNPVQITVVSADANMVTGHEMVSPSAASMLGASLVIPQEYPNLRCRCIDFSVEDFGSSLSLKRQLTLADELAVDHPPSLVALRRGQRWVRTFEKARLQKPRNMPARLREGGVYLITGGLGRIGLEVAEYLARNLKAKLVLVGRTEFPSKHKLNECSTISDQDSKQCRKLKRVLNLRNLGAEVLVRSADVSRLEEVRGVISEARERFGSIHGVIHAAGHTGLMSLKTIAKLTLDEFEAHFRPKVLGTEVLRVALADERLDFILLFSSLSSVLGGIGYSAYAAANASMDVLSHKWGRGGASPCLTVNWDGWDFRDSTEARAQAGSTLALAMSPQEGLQALRYILEEDKLTGQIVVSSANLTERIAQWVDRPTDQDNVIAGADFPSRSGTSREYVAPQNALQEAIKSIWEEILKIPCVGIYDDFTKLGGHSLLGMRICSRVRELFELNFTVADLYDSPTVAGIADFITKALITAAAPGQIDGLIEQL